MDWYQSICSPYKFTMSFNQCINTHISNGKGRTLSRFLYSLYYIAYFAILKNDLSKRKSLLWSGLLFDSIIGSNYAVPNPILYLNTYHHIPLYIDLFIHFMIHTLYHYTKYTHRAAGIGNWRCRQPNRWQHGVILWGNGSEERVKRKSDIKHFLIYSHAKVLLSVSII